MKPPVQSQLHARKPHALQLQGQRHSGALFRFDGVRPRRASARSSKGKCREILRHNFIFCCIFTEQEPMMLRNLRGTRTVPKPRSSNSVTSNRIVRHAIEQERRVWKAAQARDAEAFRQLVPADGIMIFQSGITRQPEYLATMNSRTVSHSKWRKMKGFMPNQTTVILTYETVRVGSYKGKKFPSNPVIESTTWIKRGKRWVAILNQETPVKV
jgi:hypothetical protein